MYNIVFYDYVASFGAHEEVTDEMLRVIGANATNPMLQLILASPQLRDGRFSIEEQLEYNAKLIEQADRVYDLCLDDSIKRLCSISLVHPMTNDEAMMRLCDEASAIEVEVGSWAWILRENLRFTLLGALTAQGKEFDRIRELVALMKEHTASFASLWNAAQSEANANLRI